MFQCKPRAGSGSLLNRKEFCLRELIREIDVAVRQKNGDKLLSCLTNSCLPV